MDVDKIIDIGVENNKEKEHNFTPEQYDSIFSVFKMLRKLRDEHDARAF